MGDRPPVLITGVSGFIGRVLVEMLRPAYEVFGVARSGDAANFGCDRFCVADLSREDAGTALRALVDGKREFAAVVHAAALTPRYRESDPERLHRANAAA